MIERFLHLIKEKFSIEQLLLGALVSIGKWAIKWFLSKYKEILTIFGIFLFVRFLIALQDWKFYKPSPREQTTLLVLIVCFIAILALRALDKRKENQQPLIKNI